MQCVETLFLLFAFCRPKFTKLFVNNAVFHLMMSSCALKIFAIESFARLLKSLRNIDALGSQVC